MPGGADFTDADLALAADLQPALRALTAQADVLGSRATDWTGPGCSLGSPVASLPCCACSTRG